MPTGYTAPIADGITFKEYAMGCARAFGALIMMRDEPQNAEIPEAFEASNYHKDAIEKAGIELKALLSMDYAEASLRALADHQKLLAYHNEAIAKNSALLAKYEAMLAQVKAYVSPSREHDEFKNFMARQIKESIEFDCDSQYHKNAIKSAKLMSGAEWILAEKKRLEDSMEYHKKRHQEELDRTNGRTEWVRKLRESLA